MTLQTPQATTKSAVVDILSSKEQDDFQTLLKMYGIS
jgi:hypothetical protein